MKWKSFLIMLLFFFPATMLKAQQAALEKVSKQLGIPAIQVVHVKNGKQLSLAYGKKKADSSAVITENTIFQAASLTKVLAAYTFFRLYDKGLMTLDKPLYDYFPYNRLKNEPQGQLITARMVLTHRTGLLNWEGNVGTEDWKSSPLHVQFTPGTNYKYSGEGFYYLQLAMEKVTGKPFKQLVLDEVLKPLGMNHSDMQWNEHLFSDYAYGHYSQDKPRRLAKWSYTNTAYTLYTTALDYTKFVQKALAQGKGLKPTTHKLMVGEAGKVQKEPGLSSEDDKHVPCALGMRLQYNEKGIWLWHTGSNPGFRCFFIVNLKTKESLVSFTNSDTGMPAFNELMKLFLEKGQTFWAYTWRNGELD